MLKRLFIQLLILLIIGSIYCQYIVLKFRTNINLNSINENNYIKLTTEQQIYVDLKIGETNQVIPMTLKSMKYPTFVVSSKAEEEDILVKYDESKSPNTLKYLIEDKIENLYIYDFTKGYYVSDNLEFDSSNIYNNFTYILATQMNAIVKNISGEIGLSKKTENKTNYIYPQKTNFIEQLYNNKLISKKIFGIKYDTEYEGRLILGAALDEIDSWYKPDEQIINEIDNDVPNNNRDDWLIKFNVNFKKNQDEEFNEKSYGFLQFEFGLIIGSNNYYQNFILNYFETKQCTKNTINSSPYSFYQYTCDNENQFEDFPDLNLSLEDKYNFSFNKIELFKKFGNKYFFLIVFQISQININYWRLGQLFFRKYPTFLINDGKTGQFLYYPINKDKEDEGDEGESEDENENEGGESENEGEESENEGGESENEGGESENQPVKPSDTDKKDDDENTGLIVSLSVLIPLIVIGIVAFLIYHYRKRNKKFNILLKDLPESDSNESYPIIDN